MEEQDNAVSIVDDLIIEKYEDDAMNASTCAVRISENGRLKEEEEEEDGGGVQSSIALAEVEVQNLQYILEHMLLLTHLATFGIIGKNYWMEKHTSLLTEGLFIRNPYWTKVLIRYGLQVWFGPSLLGVMNDATPLYLDLPANMVGCFFMGLIVIFKKDISLCSEHLLIGLSTGLMGSITTLSGWIQKMVNIATKGNWIASLIGLLVGTELAQMSLFIGIETAELLKWIITYSQDGAEKKGSKTAFNLFLRSPRSHKISTFIFFIACALLWGCFITLAVWNDLTSPLWLACALAPPGVWVRWFLARLNGRGIGPKRYLKWLPLGTLLVNLIASAIQACLSVVKLVVKTEKMRIMIGGFQLGFLGCMSTVSSLVAEVCVLHRAGEPWQAYAYILLTLVPAFLSGIFLYSIPVWNKGDLHSKHNLQMERTAFNGPLHWDP